MVGSQKILTVSYGTFSCTLEGFEDSFDTMKAIAEYFRDLAAEDRYFGAEPPVPDTEMLARIAEREVARRVKARLERTGLVLRVDEAEASASSERAEQVAPAAPATPSAPAKPPPPEAQAPREEGVVAKLARIRAAASGSGLMSAEEEAGDSAPTPVGAPAGEAADAPSSAGPATEASPEAVTAADEPDGADDATLASVAHLRPRIVGVPRAEAGAESDAGHPFEAPGLEAEGSEAEPTATAGAGPAGPANLLSAEAEAELMAELAALEAAVATSARPEDEPQGSDDAAQAAVAGLLAALDGAGDVSPERRSEPTASAEPRVEDAPAEDDATEAPLRDAAGEPAAPEDRARPRHLAPPPAGDDAAVSRLLSQADAQLAEPEASRRREAIAQLRAAVAATEAARRLGAAVPEPEDREDPFRDDLRHVVRPRRPVPSAEGRAEPRAERPRPAPLKLVAAQRVDIAEDAVALAEPVRPRRVGLQTPSGGTSGDTFAAFAAEMGAVSLTDILEAAAAYTSFVEGAEDFSRLQLLDRVRQASPAAFSREDGLRSFGTLLRQGTIIRVRGGRFQVTGESRFNPARRAG